MEYKCQEDSVLNHEQMLFVRYNILFYQSKLLNISNGIKRKVSSVCRNMSHMYNLDQSLRGVLKLLYYVD